MSVTTPHPRQKPGGLNNRRPASAPSVENPAENPVENVNWAGKELYSILRLLAVPALFVLSIIVFKLHPGKIGLYGFALVFGLLLLIQLR
ncbi:MAG: O-antigen polymerase, partial [Thiomonas sp.]